MAWVFFYLDGVLVVCFLFNALQFHARPDIAFNRKDCHILIHKLLIHPLPKKTARIHVHLETVYHDYDYSGYSICFL